MIPLYYIQNKLTCVIQRLFAATMATILIFTKLILNNAIKEKRTLNCALIQNAIDNIPKGQKSFQHFEFKLVFE